MHAIASMALQGLTLKGLLSDIPHDGGAIIGYVLCAAFFFLCWYGSRPSVMARYQRREPEASPEEQADHRDIDEAPRRHAIREMR